MEDDFLNGPVKAMSYMGKVAALLYHRYKNGKKQLKSYKKSTIQQWKEFSTC